LTQIDRFITVSGDGLLNEMLNGLMARQDWVDAVKIPLGIIPAGSGNAVSTAMGYPNPVRTSDPKPYFSDQNLLFVHNYS
jgi:diacylglycerol kinase family enzyme